MTKITEDEAIYRIRMAEHYLNIILERPDILNVIKMNIDLGLSEKLHPVNAWSALKPLLGIIGVQINKPKQPVGDIRKLSGEQIKWRYENWTCSNPFHYFQDGTKHCGDCGTCGHSKGDSRHACTCPECSTPYCSTNCPTCGR